MFERVNSNSAEKAYTEIEESKGILEEVMASLKENSDDKVRRNKLVIEFETLKSSLAALLRQPKLSSELRQKIADDVDYLNGLSREVYGFQP